MDCFDNENLRYLYGTELQPLPHWGMLVHRILLSLSKGALSLDSPSVFFLLPLLMHLSSELMFFLHINTVNHIIAKCLGNSACVYVCYLLSCVRLLATPWMVTHHTPLSMGFSSQEYWSGLLFPSPGDLPFPNPGIKPRSPALQADSLPSEPLSSLYFVVMLNLILRVLFPETFRSLVVFLVVICKYW